MIKTLPCRQSYLTVRTWGESLSTAFWSTACIALGAGLLIAVLGLDRPYDAIPDQDLLWLREALLMHQGKAPGYPDHPGAFWQVLYTLKLKLLSINNPLAFGEGVAITSGDASLIIRWARLENGILAGLTSLSLWPTLRQLGIQRWLAAISVITTSLCLGTLESAVQIRNELTSTFFSLCYLNLSLLLPSLKRRKSYTTASIAALTCFLAAAYCKVQVLILSPFWFLLLLGEQHTRECNDPHSRLTRIINPQDIKALINSLVLGSAAWLLAVSGPVFATLNRFQHVRTELDLPFWTVVNALLMLTTWARSPNRNQPTELAKVGLIYVGITLLISRVVTYPIWTAQVFSFPSNSLGFSSGENRFELLQEGLYKYLTDLFLSSPSLTALLLTGLVIALIAQAIHNRAKGAFLENTWILLLLTCSCVIWSANAMRPRGFYEIYLIIPALITLTLATPAQTRRTFSTRSIARFLAFPLIALAFFKSVSNIQQFGAIARMAQPREYLCFEQAFDQALRKTSIATCSNFDDYIKKHSSSTSTSN